ncbi:MAG: CoA transferase [Thaumarchaeota archaeon]|nr:CoA transferase [Nitrososphaerota archaeon]
MSDQIARSGPLKGLKILDLTQFVSGPFCTQILADLGARVVKIERLPEGDPYRMAGPSFVDGESTLFLSLNRGKESVALNLKDDKVRKLFLEKLVPNFDILIENFSPGTMDSLGIGSEVCRTANPSLIYASISGFGHAGPLREKKGFDLILQSATGIMDLTGEEDSGPVKVGIPITDFAAGLYAAVGILASCYERKKAGTSIATSLYESSISLLSVLACDYFASGNIPRRMGSASPTFAPYQAFQCRDSFITVAGAGSEEIWHRFTEAIEMPELATDSRFVRNSDRVRNQEELTQIINQKLKERDSEDWLEVLDAKGVPSSRVNTLPQVLSEEQTRALELVSETPVRDEGTDAFKSIRLPLSFNGKPIRNSSSPPMLGEHTNLVLSEVGIAGEYVDELRAKKSLL